MRADAWNEAEQELVQAAVALPYWPGRLVPENYAPPLLRFLKARKRLIQLAQAVGFSPAWPEVRCTQCANVYVPKRDGIIIVGRCPRCGCGTFNTSISVGEGFAISELDS